MSKGWSTLDLSEGGFILPKSDILPDTGTTGQILFTDNLYIYDNQWKNISTKQETSFIVHTMQDMYDIPVGDILTEDKLGSGQRRLGMVVKVAYEDSRVNLFNNGTIYPSVSNINHRTNILENYDFSRYPTWYSNFKRIGWFSDYDLSGEPATDTVDTASIFNTTSLIKGIRYRCVVDIQSTDGTVEIILVNTNQGYDGSEIIVNTFNTSGVTEFDLIIPENAAYDTFNIALRGTGISVMNSVEVYPYFIGKEYVLRIENYWMLSDEDKLSALGDNSYFIPLDDYEVIGKGFINNIVDFNTLVKPGKYYLMSINRYDDANGNINNIPQWFIDDSGVYGTFLEIEGGYNYNEDAFYTIIQKLTVLDSGSGDINSGRKYTKTITRAYQEEEDFWSDWTPDTYLGTPETFNDNLRFRNSKGISWYKRDTSPIGTIVGTINITSDYYDMMHDNDNGFGFDLEIGKEYELVIDNIVVDNAYQIFCGTKQLYIGSSTTQNFRFRANNIGLYIVADTGGYIDLTDVELYGLVEDVFDYSKYLTSQSGGGGISGQSYLIVNGNQSTPELNGTDLFEQYELLKSLTPYGNAISATNRVTLLVFPGDYNLTTDSIIGSNFCDIVGVGDNNNIIIRAEGNNKFDMSPSPDIIINNLRFHSITTDELEPKNSKLVIADDSPTVTLKNLLFSTITADNDYGDLISTPETQYVFNGYYENIISTNNASIFSSETNSINLSGKFVGCKNLNLGVSLRPIGSTNNQDIILSGIFIECGNENIDQSFGYSSSGSVSITGYFKNCKAGSNSFGYTTDGLDIGIFGTFIDCTAGNYSFGYCDAGGTVTISASYTNCIGGTYCFGVGSGDITISGTYTDCKSGTNSFGYSSTNNLGFSLETNATYNRCTGNNYCFGSTNICHFNLNSISKYIDCVGGTYSFGSIENSLGDEGSSIMNGYFLNCTATDYSFGSTVDQPCAMYGTFINCIGRDYCFGYIQTANILFYDFICTDCKARDYSFGSADDTRVIMSNSSQKITNCVARDYSFCYSVSGTDVTLFKNIIGCEANNYSFGASSSVTCTITLENGSLIQNSIGKSRCFGAAGIIIIEGIIDNCISDQKSFGYSTDGDVTISGTIKNCTGTVETCFGCTTNGNIIISGYIRDCFLLEGSGFGCSLDSFSGEGDITISGSIVRCRSASNSFGSSYIGIVDITSDAIIDSCIGNDYCYGFSFTGNITIAGKLTNCVSDANSYGYTFDTSTITLSGNFTDCKGSTQCFGSGDTFLTYINTATYIRCISGNSSFIYSIADGITINGTYIDCIGGNSSFGATSGTNTFTLNGTYDKCISGDSSFGFNEEGTVIVSGIFAFCKSSSSSFGCAPISTLSGTFIDCISGERSYGGNIGGTSTLSGKFERCISDRDSFGSANYITPGGNQILSGTFIDCISGEASFGFLNNGPSDITLSGTFIRCIAGIDNEDDFGSFGCNNASSVGSVITLSGSFEECKSLTLRSFGYSDDIINVSGSLKNCKSFGGFGQSPLFTLTNTGVIDSCSNGFFGMGSGTISGTLKNLLIDGSGLTSDTITVTATAKIEDCTVRANTGYYCISAPSSTTIRVLRSNFNLTTPYLNITNSITEANALNIKDTGI